ncbi:MAG: signal peptide peptidase SppA [Deltaproteobacteria bacterium]|nr:MAG: signal peptide peptidase SppA [Deltaproteobacteria bacterium]
MKTLIRMIFNLFKYLGKTFTFIRNLILNIVFFACIALLAAVFFFPKEEEQALRQTSDILRLDIYGDIVEKKRLPQSFEKLLGEELLDQSRRQETLLQDILDVIGKASQDDSIHYILLNLRHMENAGLNQIQTIGEALDSFKKAGKLVVAAEDYYSQPQYFLASYADQLFINPAGFLDLHGLGVYRLYYKEAVEALHINYNIFKVGGYKSALEPFTRNDMSALDKEQNEVWLSKIWQIMTHAIAQNRDIRPFALRQYTHNLAERLQLVDGDAARLALEAGLVDKIATRRQLENELKALFQVKKEKIRFTSTREYLQTITRAFSPCSNENQNVGLIVAEGIIMPGEQVPGQINSDSLIQRIRKAEKDETIKALVLRINSGGGSAFASEIIRQALVEFKKTGKPLVVSMGSVAASGGYWIAADADQIWAEKTTITGSIGIFGAIPTFENSLASLGVHNDGLGTTPIASGIDITRPLANPLKEAIQLNIEHSYAEFIDIVAKGRELDRSKVEKLAQGRVYDGGSARDLGLVDELGNLDDAIKAAGKMIGQENCRARYIEEDLPDKFHLLRFLLTTTQEQIQMQSLLAKLLPFWSSKPQQLFLPGATSLGRITDPAGVFALCHISPYLR